jgi:hypothetical protein
MRVVTPAMKLEVEIEQAALKDDRLVLTGLAGFLPCETSLGAAEARALLGKVLRPAVLWWVLTGGRAKKRAGK